MVAAPTFWLCQVLGSAKLCPNISRAVPSIDDGSSNVLFTTYFGAYPILDSPPATKAGHRWCNGGIPQLANLSLHAQHIERDLDAKVSTAFAGLVVLDYESWWPIWNATTNELYRNASRALARSQLPPDASAADVETKAVADFNEASLRFHIFTVNYTRHLRPHARIGIYSGIQASYWHDEPALDLYIARAQLPWWDSLDVIMPSVYLPYSSAVVPAANLSAYVARRLSGAAQVNTLLRQDGKPPKPIIPYVWARYHESSSPHALELLTEADAQIEFFGMALRKVATQAIIWGNENVGPNAPKVLRWFAQRKVEFGAEPSRPTMEQQPAAASWKKDARALLAPKPGQKPSNSAVASLSPHPPIDPHGPIPPFVHCNL